MRTPLPLLVALTPSSHTSSAWNVLKAGGRMYLLQGSRSCHRSVEVTKFSALKCSQLSIYGHAKTHRIHSITMGTILNNHISRLARRMWGAPHLRPPHCGRRGPLHSLPCGQPCGQLR